LKGTEAYLAIRQQGYTSLKSSQWSTQGKKESKIMLKENGNRQNRIIKKKTE
jgi:hypothetical protein